MVTGIEDRRAQENDMFDRGPPLQPMSSKMEATEVVRQLAGGVQMACTSLVLTDTI